ncbi:MAG: 1-deoxy-D-xylulose-5-phosphate reductoisomerase [Eubacterium sp.]|nr:1-deoxy-D-xylulose-5-phosphate reductoisomerase [Eubacterium sp.]
MKRIALIGSTGSIGTQTLEIVRNNPEEYKVVALACGRNLELIEKQMREFHPSFVSVGDEEGAENLRAATRDLGIPVASGMTGLCEAAAHPDADVTVTAIVGMIGVQPTLAAIEAGKTIALANKETLVTAGHLVKKAAKEKRVMILPVDSEHSAIFQSLQGNTGNKISRILLTASGGPFRGRTREELEHVTLADALKHPNWSMGQKITIDSATMVNKGLEVIEASWLFDVEPSRIEVLVQPQSIIHSAVEYEDGAVIAQLGTPDMKLPIQYALTWPKREYLPGDRLDFTKMSAIYLEQPDMKTFRGLEFAYRAAEAGGVLPTAMNAANEYAVAHFLKEKIRFLEIYDWIEYAMDTAPKMAEPSVEEILAEEADTIRRLGEKFLK